MLVLQNQGWMVVRFRRGPKASQEAAVSLVVAARAAHFGRQAGGSVGRMSCAIDGVAVAFADGAVASGKDVEPGDVLVDDYVVHMAATVAGMADETSEVAYLIARSIAHGGEIGETGLLSLPDRCCSYCTCCGRAGIGGCPAEYSLR